MLGSHNKRFIFGALAKAHADQEAAAARIAFWRGRAEACGMGHLLLPEHPAAQGQVDTVEFRPLDGGPVRTLKTRRPPQDGGQALEP